MQYDVSTPEDYMASLEDDWRRETLLQLRSLIKEKAPGIVEGINYKMLSYSDDKGIVFHLNAQKAYVSLYLGDAGKIDSDGSLLAGLDHGKGCIRFKKSVDVAATRIDAFIERAFSLREQGVAFDC